MESESSARVVEHSSPSAVRVQYEAELAVLNNQLIDAKQHEAELAAANRRIAELEASSRSTSARLASIVEADALQEEEVRLLRDRLRAEQKHATSLDEQLHIERARADSLAADLATIRSEFARYRADVEGEQKRQVRDCVCRTRVH